MKRTLLLIAAPLVMSVCGHAVGSTTTASTMPTMIYAAIRTDGVAGAGTSKNPYDASTEAKFDAILANLLAKNGAQRIILNLAAGTYTVTPVRVATSAANPAGFVSNIPANLEIIGAGENKTTIRAGIVHTGYSTYWIFAQIGIQPGDYFENLTIDCNSQNQTAPHVTIDGIECLHVAGGATHTLASYVHVINGGSRAGDPGYSEWSGILFKDFQEGTTSEITHCRVDQYQGVSACTALVTTQVMTDNTVILNNSDPDNLALRGGGGGYQNAFSPSATESGNVCQNCTWGIYSDVDNQVNENIENNTLSALYGGVWLYTWSPGTTLQNIYVHNNKITKTYEAAVTIGNSATTVTGSDFYVYNNTITTLAPATMHTDNLIYLVATENSEVYGNTFNTSPNTGNSFPINISLSGDVGTIAWFDNKYSNGTVIPGPAGSVNQALSTVSTPGN
jgi:hypothetical protein